MAMASISIAAISTGVEQTADGATPIASTTTITLAESASAVNGETPSLDPRGAGKYKHIYATHATARPSTLSHDAISTPSFIGFRNLMVLVLSALPPIVHPYLEES